MALGYDMYDLRKNSDLRIEKIDKSKCKKIVYTWGNGWESRLGHGDKENQLAPKEIQTNFDFKEISAGGHHSAAIDEQGILIVWGPYCYFGV
jgi:alpha-tubulin suppressor-like RCC1 family protein